MKRLTIDEVIQHCKRKVAKIESMFRKEHLESDNCGVADVIQNEYWEHRQVAEWLEELKDLKEKNVAKKPKYQKIQYGKHKWKRKENGEIDDFAWGYAYCNGVVCEVCGETQCVHCNPKYEKLKDCEVEDYFCPTCNETVGYFYSHCKHCWQKLDWQ